MTWDMDARRDSEFRERADNRERLSKERLTSRVLLLKCRQAFRARCQSGELVNAIEAHLGIEVGEEPGEDEYEITIDEILSGSMDFA